MRAQGGGIAGARRHFKLVAFVAAAGVVTVAMVFVDALTRDAMPTPAANELVEIKVRSALLLPASGPLGLRRKRARLTVRLRVTNISGRRLRLGQAVLLAGKAKVRPDLSGRARPYALLSPLARGTSAEDELWFETAGEVTRLVAGRRVHLRLAGQTVPVPVRSLLGSAAP